MDKKEFETEVLMRLTAIETKLDDYSKIKDRSEEAWIQSKSNKKDIGEMQDKIRWLTRTLVAALITGLVTLGVSVVKIIIEKI